MSASLLTMAVVLAVVFVVYERFGVIAAHRDGLVDVAVQWPFVRPRSVPCARVIGGDVLVGIVVRVRYGDRSLHLFVPETHVALPTGGTPVAAVADFIRRCAETER